MPEYKDARIKKGTFYLSSKEDEGDKWEKQTFQNPQDPDETLTRYHKKINLEGNLDYVGLEDDKYKGKVAKIGVKKDDTVYTVKIPIMSKGAVEATNQYFNSVVGPLEKLKKGDPVNMFINTKNYDKNDRLYRNIVVLDGDGNLVKSNFSFKDVPSWGKEETTDSFGDKKIEWDPTNANRFYIDRFRAVVDGFAKNKPDPVNKDDFADNKEPKGINSKNESDLPF